MTRKRVPCPFCICVMACASMRSHIRAHHDVKDQILKCLITGCGEEYHQFATNILRKHLAGNGIIDDTPEVLAFGVDLRGLPPVQ